MNLKKRNSKLIFFCRRRLKISQRLTKRKEERTKFVTQDEALYKSVEPVDTR